MLPNIEHRYIIDKSIITAFNHFIININNLCFILEYV